ncbi:AMP-dependent synthetase/ligase [Arboricoccus pini]|uniref:AMP-dependent synthetase/ligase n=1 Tax=Arboricoccus pini TaxID=1963835 RepID=UPI0013FD9AD4|nr:long-chain fatty acid--CoA ligase [Arboricoccus pini]
MSPVPQTLLALFERSLKERADRPFLYAKIEGRYRAQSWTEVATAVGALAAKLAALGVMPGDRVAIIAENGPRWAIADLAIQKAGGVTVPSYTTYTSEDYQFVLANAGVKLVLCSGGAIAKRVLPAIALTPDIVAVVGLDGPLPAMTGLPPLLTFDQALEEGAGLPPATGGAERGPDDLACLIYTSGTGGRPKGVMLSHKNILSNIRGVEILFRQLGIRDLVFLSFLPLSHAYEHTAGLMAPIAMGAEIWYAEGVETLQTNLQEARPHVLTCVPRLFEVFKQRLEQGMARRGGLQAKLFAKTVALGTKAYHGRLAPHEWLLDRVLDLLVRRKVKARFGGRLAAMVSGGGALSHPVGIFFQALGLPVCQGYGQTETSPVVSVNPPWEHRVESAGPPLAGVEVKIADDGEILIKGDLVMQGYWREPEMTAAAIENGWLKTGDIGHLDAKGALHITDRKKDIIVLSGGDNIAPQRLEGMMALEPDIAQSLVFGDGKPYVGALIVPSAELLRDYERPDGPKRVEQRIEAAMKRVNAHLSSVERIRRWRLVTTPFSIENGMMTPTLKLRRGIIAKTYQLEVDSLFSGNRSLAA